MGTLTEDPAQFLNLVLEAAQPREHAVELKLQRGTLLARTDRREQADESDDEDDELHASQPLRRGAWPSCPNRDHRMTPPAMPKAGAIWVANCGLRTNIPSAVNEPMRRSLGLGQQCWDAFELGP